jgi:hypothetical protein
MESDLSDLSDLIKGENLPKNELKDIRTVEINIEQSPSKRKAEYLKQVGDSGKHKCGEITINSVFNEKRSINKILNEVIKGTRF